jgi:hypothetical protein
MVLPHSAIIKHLEENKVTVHVNSFYSITINLSTWKACDSMQEENVTTIYYEGKQSKWEKEYKRVSCTVNRSWGKGST